MNGQLLREALALRRDLGMGQRPLKYLACLKALSRTKYMTANEIARRAEQLFRSVRLDSDQAAGILRILHYAGYVERKRNETFKTKWLYRRNGKQIPTPGVSES